MKCSNPVPAYRTTHGARHHYEHRCGKCAACRITMKAGWKGRILMEALDWSDSSFITLTYNEKHVPLNQNLERILHEPDLRNFVKRLRKATGRKYRYFACGEYGSDGNRPHYHLILFGHSFIDIDPIKRAWSRYSRKSRTYESIGFVECSYITTARCGYVAKYTLKRLGEPGTVDESHPQEFATMSRRPGIGTNYVVPLTTAIYQTAERLGETPVDVFRNHFKAIRIGSARLPIHPTIKNKVWRQIELDATKNMDIHQKIAFDSKNDLRKARAGSESIELVGKASLMIQENDAKIKSERRLRRNKTYRRL
jgi:hypothetical protein